jgi:hypothetical protein
VTGVDISLACGLLISFYLFWRIDQLHHRLRRVESDGLLREVITVSVQLSREYFSEALKLSDEEIDGSPQAVRGMRLRLLTWKAHYTGDIAFFRGPGEDPKRESVYEFPTVSFQFPLELARCCLFGEADERQDSVSGFGPGSPEKLAVLLSHKAIIIRARDGRFDWRVSSGHSYKPGPSDLVIPIREDDLHDYLDTYGHDDLDWVMVAGHARRYKRDGRWATWSMTAIYPEALSSTTSVLDKSAVKPNDKDKMIDDNL